MFYFQCSLDPSIALSPIDYATASEMDLRYAAAFGDVRLIGDTEPELLRRVPILDFLACMRSIRDRLRQGSPLEVFEDTESEFTLEFVLHGEGMVVEVSGHGFLGVCGIGELDSTVESELARCMGLVLSYHPELRSNHDVHRWLGHF